MLLVVDDDDDDWMDGLIDYLTDGLIDDWMTDGWLMIN